MTIPIRPVLFLFAVALTATTTLPAAAQNGTAARSVRAGAYTSLQAEKGDTLFRTVCGECHSPSQFSGPSFEVVWTGRPVFDFFHEVRSTMPLNNPGGLTREEYAAVVAYILKLNALPAGETPLPDDDEALKQIQFEAAGGAARGEGSRR